MLRTVTDLSFLALIVLLITTLLAGRYDSGMDAVVSLEIQSLRKDFLEVSMKNVTYLETKINRIGESSDGYQVGISRRIQVLESRMESLEARSKGASRVSNINTNTINK